MAEFHGILPFTFNVSIAYIGGWDKVRVGWGKMDRMGVAKTTG